MGIREIVQVSYKELGEASAFGMCKWLLGNEAKVAVSCSQGRKGDLSLTRSVCGSGITGCLELRSYFGP